MQKENSRTRKKEQMVLPKDGTEYIVTKIDYTF